MTITEIDPRRLDLAGSFGLRVGNQDASEVRIGTAGRWEQRVNLATNPSFEGTSMAFATVRENLFMRKAGVAAITSFAWQNIATATITSVQDARFPGGYAFSAPIASDATGQQWFGSPMQNANSPAVTAGLTYTASMYVLSDTPQTGQAIIPWRDASEANFVSSPALGQAVDIPANVLTRVVVTAVAPDGAVTGGLRLRSPSTTSPFTPGSTMLFGGMQFEVGPVARPYFDGATAPALRTNLWDNLTGLAGTVGRGFAAYSGTGGASGQAWLDAPHARSGRARRVTFTAVPTTTADFGVNVWDSTSRAWTPALGRRYTIAFSARTNAANMTSAATAWGGIGPHATIVAQSSAQPIGENTTARLWRTIDTNVLNSSRVCVAIQPQNISVGTWAEIFDIDVYEGDYDPTREFVAPGQTDSVGLVAAWAGTANASATVVTDPDLAVAWSGTANQSTSLLRGISVLGISPESTTRAVIVSSTRWAVSGARSARIVPTRGVGGTQRSMNIGTGSTVAAGNTNLLRPGRSYRISVTGQLMGTAPGGPKIVVQWNTVDGWTGAVTVQTAQPPGTPGPIVLTLSVSPPADAVWVLLRIQGVGVIDMVGGASENGEVWFDNVIVEDVTDGIPEGTGYFDGSTPSSAELLYHWTGPVNGSTSVETTAWAPASEA